MTECRGVAVLQELEVVGEFRFLNLGRMVAEICDEVRDEDELRDERVA